MENIKSEKTERFMCSACGGNLAFDPKLQKLKCENCDSVFEIDNTDNKIEEYDLLKAKNRANSWGADKRVIKCDNCGGETVITADMAASECAFCGSSHIVKTEDKDLILPESVVPFKIDKKSAQASFSEWIKNRFFAPSNLKKMYSQGKINGVYIPCWTYDSDADASYSAEGGTYYYEKVMETVEKDGKTEIVTKEVRKTRWWPTNGTYSSKFDDLLINASKKIDSDLMSQIAPFNLKELVGYKPEFISGYLAERYSISLENGWDQAKKQIDESLRQGIIRKINADEVKNLFVNAEYKNVKYKQILLPIWISGYTYKNKVYNFIVNGQTGKVEGYAPVSKLKVATLILAILGIAGLIYYFFNM